MEACVFHVSELLWGADLCFFIPSDECAQKIIQSDFEGLMREIFSEPEHPHVVADPAAQLAVRL
jgi:hypothetical protein